MDWWKVVTWKRDNVGGTSLVFRLPEGAAFLEEDCDAGVFLTAYRAARGCDPATETVLHAGDAPCRSLPHYPAPAGWKDRMYAILRGAAPAPATVREGGAS